MKKVVSLLLALCLIFSLVACSAGEEEAPASAAGNSAVTGANEDGSAKELDLGTQVAAADAEEKKATTEQIDHVSYALNSASFDLKPYSNPASGRAQTFQYVWARLVYLKNYGDSLEDAEMWCAKSFTRVDDVTCDIELYDNIYDSKGNHITASDVKFSYEMCGTVGQCVEVAALYKDIEVLDDYHLRFTLKSPGTGKFETLFGFHRMAIVNQAWYENATEEELLSDVATCGPYTIKEYVAGSRIVFEANENYWKKDKSLCGIADSQNVKTIYCPVIAEASVRAIAMENKEIDFTDINVTDLGSFMENGQAKPGYNVKAMGGTSCYDVFCNMDEQSGSPVATNPKLREAICYAIDPDAMRIAAGLDDSCSWLCYDMGTPLMAGFNEEWKDTYYKYDPEYAKQCLAESGFTGKLRLLYANYHNPGMCAVLLENLNDIGLDIEVLAYDQALFTTYYFDSSAWDIELDSKGGYSLLDYYNNMFSGAGYTNGGVNFCKDQQLYDLIDKGFLSGEQEDINAIHNRLQELYMGRGVYSPASIYVAQDGIINIVNNHYMYPVVNAFTYAEDFVSNYAVQ